MMIKWWKLVFVVSVIILCVSIDRYEHSLSEQATREKIDAGQRRLDREVDEYLKR